MLVVVAISLRLFAGAAYVRAVITGKARPHVVSWFFWGLTALIAFGVQLSQGVGSAAFVTLALGAGPVVVFGLAIAKGMHRVTFSRIDKWCAVLTAAGVVLWLLTKNPLAALWLSIGADIVSSIPTVIKCYHRPHTEHALPYGMSMASMILTLLGTGHWTVAAVAFPAYILCINTVFTTLTASRVGPRLRQWRVQKEHMGTAG